MGRLANFGREVSGYERSCRRDFGLGLICNALLFVPQVLAVWRKKSDEGISLITFGGFNVLQVIGMVHGVYESDFSLILGMIAQAAVS